MRHGWLAGVVLLSSVPAHAQWDRFTQPGPPARMGGSTFPPQGNPTTESVLESELELLDSYRGFSRDSRLYAYTETPPLAGVPMLFFESTDPNFTDVPRPIPLDSEQARRDVLNRLDSMGFARPGQERALPSDLTASLQDGTLVVSRNGFPLNQEVKPFQGTPIEPLRSSLVAVSPNGDFAAVRTLGQRADGEPVVPEHDVVSLLSNATPTVPNVSP